MLTYINYLVLGVAVGVKRCWVLIPRNQFLIFLGPSYRSPSWKCSKEKGFEADTETYHVLVQGFGRHRKRKKWEDVLDEMLDLEFIPNIASYNRLLGGLPLA
jgi:pentatricopeptide repeat protein